MVNYATWQRKKVSVTTLRLDSKNPRLTDQGKNVTQPEIINYLIEEEKAYDLAKMILSQGFFLNEAPIVVYENGKIVVLEGNRRIAACKMILNPNLIANATKRGIIKKMSEDFDLSSIKKIEVYISPTRRDADVMIMNRHTAGSVVEKWDKTKQDRFLYNRYKGGETIEEMSKIFAIAKSEVKKALQRFNVFTEINKLKLPEKSQKILKDEVKFNMTNVERVYDSKHGRNFLGIDFSEEGQLVRKLPKEEFEKRLLKVTEAVIDGSINSRTLNTEKEKEKYFAKLLTDKNFNASIKPDTKYNFSDDESIFEEDNNSQEERKPKVTKASAGEYKLFTHSLNFVSDNKRIDNIFQELKTLSLKSQINAAAVLMRSYIDMVTYQFLKKKDLFKEMIKEEGVKIKANNDKIVESVIDLMKEAGARESKIDSGKIQKVLKSKGSVNKDFIPSLRSMLDYMSKSDVISDVKLKQSLQSHLNKSDSLVKIIGHYELNLLVHNEYHHADIKDLKSTWSRLEPILSYMISEIK